MLLHLVFLTATFLHVLALQVRVTGTTYESHSEVGCYPSTATDVMYEHDNTSYLYQEFEDYSADYPVALSGSSHMCFVQYNLALDEPGRVIVNARPMALSGYLSINQNTTASVVVHYNWVQSDNAVSSPVPLSHAMSIPLAC